MKRFSLALASCLLVMPLIFSCTQKVLETRIKVVCHRGLWDAPKSYENSIASLKLAQKGQYYGSEFDLNRTKDGVLIVNHDPTIQGDTIEQTNFKGVIDTMKLPNGEKVPTFEQYLAQGKKSKKTMLICEMKAHSSDSLTVLAVDEAVALIKKHDMESQMVYISFSLPACKEFAKLQPNNTVQYLGGDMTPQEVKDAGLNGIDYLIIKFIIHPDWVKQAHDLGMTVNVWTVNDIENISKMATLGVDMITTNKPELVRDILVKEKN